MIRSIRKKIAALLRGGMLPQAYVYPAAMRATRDLLRRRTHLMRKRAELLARLLPFCPGEDDKKSFACRIAAPANYAAGARAYKIVSRNDSGSFENAWASACM
jgi:hypothetical protein